GTPRRRAEAQDCGPGSRQQGQRSADHVPAARTGHPARRDPHRPRDELEAKSDRNHSGAGCGRGAPACLGPRSFTMNTLLEARIASFAKWRADMISGIEFYKSWLDANGVADIQQSLRIYDLI